MQEALEAEHQAADALIALEEESSRATRARKRSFRAPYLLISYKSKITFMGGTIYGIIFKTICKCRGMEGISR